MNKQNNQPLQAFLLAAMVAIIMLGAFGSTADAQTRGGIEMSASSNAKLVGRWRLVSIVAKNGKTQDTTATNSYNEYKADGTVAETTGKGGDLESTDTGKYTIEGDRITSALSSRKQSWTNVKTFRIENGGKTLSMTDQISTFIFKRVRVRAR